MVSPKRILGLSLGLLAVGSTASATDLTGPLTFVAITPCRIVNTLASYGFSGQAGPPSLVANADRTFQITGTVPGLPAQCGIPTNAAAISVNFTVTGFAGAGDLRVRPAGSALGPTSILNYQLENIANATSIPLGPSGGGENGITVHADGFGTDFLADVNGYYVTAPVQYEGTFISAATPQVFQCTQWNNFRASLSTSTFSRITLLGSAGTASCGTSAAVGQIVSALVSGAAFNIACDGRTWSVGNCSGTEINSRAGAAGVCVCDAALTLRPCIGNLNWGGLGGTTCGGPTQLITLRLER
jgi:hypothetical protein